MVWAAVGRVRGGWRVSGEVGAGVGSKLGEIYENGGRLWGGCGGGAGVRACDVSSDWVSKGWRMAKLAVWWARVWWVARSVSLVGGCVVAAVVV